MDRSEEFVTFVKSSRPALAGADFTGTGLKNGLPSTGSHKSASDRFVELALSCVAAFETCQQDLDGLRQQAKNRMLFDDRQQDIQTSTFRLKQTLTNLSSNVEAVEAVSKKETRVNPHVEQHRATIVRDLRTRLMNSTKDFKDILELRSKNLRQLEQRRNLYGHRPASSNQLSQRRGPSSFNAANVQSDDHFLNRQPDLEEQAQLAMMPQTNYHQSRLDAVEQIQRLVGELSGMFSRVAQMVGHQEELVLRIDATVDDSLTRLKEGQAHLLKYFQRIASQRALILKLLGIIVAFAVFFIVFLA